MDDIAWNIDSGNLLVCLFLLSGMEQRAWGKEQRAWGKGFTLFDTTE